LKTINEFKISKESNKPISVVTCYDYWSAVIINDTDIDAVLVGDSAAMVMHGFETTVNAEVEMMSYHLAAVKRGLVEKLLIADMPFLAHRKGDQYAMETVDKFAKLGANAVKIEGAASNVKIIKHIVDSGSKGCRFESCRAYDTFIYLQIKSTTIKNSPKGCRFWQSHPFGRILPGVRYFYLSSNKINNHKEFSQRLQVLAKPSLWENPAGRTIFQCTINNEQLRM